jgi:excisionase family DNA binding protein
MQTTLEQRRTGTKLPSHEQAVVDELTSVIRRHRDQPPDTLVRLVGLACQVCIGLGESRADKLARAQLRGLSVRQQLAAAEGGSLSSEEAAQRLGISKTAVLKRLEAGRLLAWREERLQAARFPRWQFDEHGRVLTGLEAVLEILGQDAHLDPWGKVLFFLEDQAGLGGRRPLDLLREGRIDEVRRAAHAYAE